MTCNYFLLSCAFLLSGTDLSSAKFKGWKSEIKHFHLSLERYWGPCTVYTSRKHCFDGNQMIATGLGHRSVRMQTKTQWQLLKTAPHVQVFCRAYVIVAHGKIKPALCNITEFMAGKLNLHYTCLYCNCTCACCINALLKRAYWRAVNRRTARQCRLPPPHPHSA